MIALIKSLSQVSDRTNQKKGNLTKRGTGNTTPKPEPQEKTKNSTVSHPLGIFVDYLKFFGENLQGVSERHEKMLVDCFLHLDFFRTIEIQSSDVDIFHVQCIPCFKETRPASGRKWDYYYENSIGVRLYISKSKTNSSQVDSLCLEFSGNPLSILIPRNNQLKIAEMIEFMLSLNDKIKLSRIDTTLEFGHELLDLKQVLLAINNCDFSGVKTAKIIYEVNDKTGIQYPTFYMGKPKSRKSIRIYETTEKHEYSAIRIEAQCRDRYAQFVGSALVEIYKSAQNSHCIHANEMSDFLRDFTLSPKTFNLVSSDSKKPWKKAEEYLELPFWTQFKKDIGSHKKTYYFAPKTSSIQKTMDWAIKQVSGLLNVLRSQFGKEYAHEILDGMADINDKKNNGLNSEGSKKVGQLKDMGFKAHVEMFSPKARKQLQSIGFYDKQIRPKYWRQNNIIDYLDLAVNPAYHWEHNSF